MGYCPPLKPYIPRPRSEREIMIDQLTAQLKHDNQTGTGMTADRLSRILAVAKLTGNPIDAHRVYDATCGCTMVNEAEIQAINIWIAVQK